MTLSTLHKSRILESKRVAVAYEDESQISDHQQSWGYKDGPWKGPGPPLLGDADF